MAISIDETVVACARPSARYDRRPVSDSARNLGPIRVGVIGDRQPHFVAQDTIEHALAHSADLLGVDVEVEWCATPTLVDGAADVLEPFEAVWCAPGSPFRSMEGALTGIRWARESRRPFLGTCAGFQHAVIEFARNVLGVADAHHAEYDDSEGASLFIDELLCSLVGTEMVVRLIDRAGRDIYGSATATERYYCRFGLDEAHTPSLAEAGLVVTGVDDADGTTRIMRIADHPFFYATLFVPQAASTTERPHPLITSYLATASALRRAT
jgi:CTP synthase (UTP-ammonia lyase)